MIEEGLFFYIGLQGFECFFYNRPAEFLLILWAEIGIPHWIDNFITGDNPVGSDHEGNRDDGTNMGGGNPGSLYLFG